jgi:hypothetical protein
VVPDGPASGTEKEKVMGVRYVSAWDKGLRNLGAHWIKEESRSGSKDHTLDSLMQMDHVIRVDDDGLVHDDARGMYAPEVNINTDSDGISVLAEHEREFIDDMARSGWTVETGWSGQNSGRYNGPIMHDSEFIGGSLAEHILTTPGYWVACEAKTLDDGEDEGWVIMHHPVHVERTDVAGNIVPGKVISNVGVSFTVEWKDGARTSEQYGRKDVDWREASE